MSSNEERDRIVTDEGQEPRTTTTDTSSSLVPSNEEASNEASTAQTQSQKSSEVMEPEAAATTVSTTSNSHNHKPSKKKKKKKKTKTSTTTSNGDTGVDHSSSHADFSSSSAAADEAVVSMATTPAPTPSSPTSPLRQYQPSPVTTKVSAQRSTAPPLQPGQRSTAADDNASTFAEPGTVTTSANVTASPASAMTKQRIGSADAVTPSSSSSSSPRRVKTEAERQEFQAKAEAAASAVRAGTAAVRLAAENAAAAQRTTKSHQALPPAPALDEGPDEPSTDTFRPTPGAYAVDRPADVYIMEDEQEDIPEELIPRQPERPAYAPAPANNVILDAEVQLAAPEYNDDGDGDDNDDPKSWFSGKRLWIIVGAVLLVIILIVVVVLVAASGGGGSAPSPASLPPTPAPTVVDVVVEPTPAPTERFVPSCYRGSTKAMWNELRRRSDFDSFLDIELCALDNIRVDLVDYEEPWVGLFPPLPAMSNMRIKCGSDGQLTNRCIVASGGTLVLSRYGVAEETAARNMTFEGITFQRGQDAFAVLQNGGDITFKNCLFRSSQEFSPIFIDYLGDEAERGRMMFRPNYPVADPSIRQTVTFDSCIFEELDFGQPASPYAANYTDFSTLVLATTPLNTVIVKNSVFRPDKDGTRNTNIDSQFPGHLIASLGAEVRIENSCFRGTSYGSGGSPVLLGLEVTDPSFTSSNVFVDETGTTCDFVSEMEIGSQPTCRGLSADASSCQSTMNDFTVFW